MDKNIRFYFINGSFLLLIILCATLFGMSIKQTSLITQQVFTQADTLIDSIVLTRRWNAGYHGVYVKKEKDMVSNPYLEKPDIIAQDGQPYTLKPPAVMTKEISHLATPENFSFHITSLRPVNPENAPDEWESQMLSNFEKYGPNFKASETIEKDGKTQFRRMRALMVEPACLTCHLKHNYKVGDVRGGISVTIPYSETLKALHSNRFEMVILGFSLVVFCGVILYFFVWRLMQRLALQKTELLKYNKHQNEILGMVAHDLRNPLGNIVGFANILKDDNLTEVQRQFLDRLCKSAEKMLGMVNDLLDVSKIKSGTVSLQKTNVEVEPFVQQILQEIELLAKKKNIELIFKPAQPLGSILMDKERMRQVLDNLLTNAVKYSPSKSKVILEVFRNSGNLVWVVQDFGVGIAAEELPKLFDEGAQISSKPTAGEPSHGFGLAIAKRMIDLHQGTIQVKSEKGVGTQFVVTLPL